MFRCFVRVQVVIAALLVTGFLQAQSQSLDRIVAIVEDGVVTKTQVDERLSAIKERFAGQAEQLPPDAILREQILDRLIMEELQMQLANRVGLRVTEAQVDRAFAELAVSNGMNPREFLEALSSMGASSLSQVVMDIRNELTLQQLQQSRVYGRMQITEAEVTNFLASAEGRLWVAPELNLQHIFIGLPGNAGPNEVAAAERQIDQILRDIAAGVDFAALAVQHSAAPNALDGGDLGWRRAVEFAPELATVIEPLQLGQVSEPVRGAGGYHLFKLNDTRGGDGATLVQQTKTRHILIMPNEIRSDTQARELIELLRARIDAGESFDELARTYSDDVSNALNGGDLGWVLPGQMVPTFEAAMMATADGEVSPPVQTEYGWHILTVESRRDVDMSNEIMRQQARNAIASQRFEEELDLWLREIRSDAFISILEQ